MKPRLVYSVLLVIAVATTLVYNLVLNNTPPVSDNLSGTYYTIEHGVLRIYGVNKIGTLPGDPWWTAGNLLFVNPGGTSHERCTSSPTLVVISAPSGGGLVSPSVSVSASTRGVYTVTQMVITASFGVNVSGTYNIGLRWCQDLLMTNPVELVTTRTYTWIINITDYRFDEGWFRVRVLPIVFVAPSSRLVRSRADTTYYTRLNCNGTTYGIPQFNVLRVNTTHVLFSVSFDIPSALQNVNAQCTVDADVNVQVLGGSTTIYASIVEVFLFPANVTRVEIYVYWVTPPATPVTS